MSRLKAVDVLQSCVRCMGNISDSPTLNLYMWVLSLLCPVVNLNRITCSGAGIMEADDRQVTTVFTVQPSFHLRHSTNRVS